MPSNQAMKAGTSIPGLNVHKNSEPIVALERSQYPDFINDFQEPMTTLAQLRKMDVEDANLKDMKRYLKLTRRLEIKEKNLDSVATK